MSRPRLLISPALAILAPLALGAGVTGPSAIPYASQIRVNSTTVDRQDKPAIAAFAEGGWVAVWRDSAAPSEPIRSRKIRRDGIAEGGEVPLSDLADSHSPAITRLDDGRFVVVWAVSTFNLAAGANTGVHARFLDAQGQPTGAVFPLHVADGFWDGVRVAPATGGGFVAVWTDFSDIWVGAFDSQGALVVPPQTANTLGGFHSGPCVARLARNAGHVLAWEGELSYGNDDSAASIQWRRLSLSGAFVGVEQQANSFTQGAQRSPAVAANANGGFAIVWHSIGDPPLVPEGDPIGNGIDLRFFTADGAPVSTETTVSFSDGNDVWNPDLVTGPNGELVASWSEFGVAIKARRIGVRFLVGPEFQVDDAPAPEFAENPRLAVDGEGDFAAVWESYGEPPGGDGDAGSIQLRAFTIGRVAHWRLDEIAGTTALDEAGLAGDDAELSAGGDPAWGWGRPGHGALAFAGGGAAAIDTSTDLTIAGAFVTLTAWLYLETPPSALAEPFASIYDASQDNYVLYLDRDAGELRFKVTTSNGTAERPGIPESELPLQQWIHVAGVYGGTGGAEIYLDGEVVDHHSNPNLFGPIRSSPAQAAAIGRDGTALRYYFDGRIDEVEVWRRALSQDEIRLFRGPFLYGDGFESGSTRGWSFVAH